MSEDPHALVVSDRTEVISESQYIKKEYKRIFIPKSVTRISDYAFAICEHLTEVIFEEGSKLRMIGECAFANCHNLTRITFPEGLEKIDQRAF